MTVYKLTSAAMTTFQGFKWQLGKTYRATGRPRRPLCSAGWLHAYDHPLVALFHNPIHAEFNRNMRLFEAKTGRIVKFDGPMKLGARSLTLVRELDVPVITTEMRVRYAIKIAWPQGDAIWCTWAKNWLTGADRTMPTARHIGWHYRRKIGIRNATAAAVSATYPATGYTTGYAARNAAMAAEDCCHDADNPIKSYGPDAEWAIDLTKTTIE